MRVVVVAFAALAVNAFGHNSGELEVTAIEVQPSVIRSGETVAISATIANHTGAIVRDSRILVAVADKQSTERNWKVVFQEPSIPVTLTIGQQINFRAIAQIQNSGWFEVGVAGAGPDARFEPTGKIVQVIEARSAALELVTTFAVFAFILTLAIIAVLTVRHLPKRKTNKQSLVVGLVLMAVALVTWILLTVFFKQIPYQFSNWIALAAIFVFIGGWLVAGASLRLGGDWRRSMRVALLAYTIIGILWSVLIYVGFNAQRLSALLSDPRRALATVALFWMWPFQMGQMLGFFYFGG